jgi:type IV pilus assembly protein PilY1
MNTKLLAIFTVLALGGGWLPPQAARAQSSSSGSCTSTNVVENFTGSTTNCSWYFFGNACLTAGSTTYSSATNPGTLPQCKTDTYYSATGTYPNSPGAYVQLGGVTGNANQDATASPSGGPQGALRFTNDSTSQAGAIISSFAFDLTQGLQVSFTTETYEGNGADGMSFFLVDDSYVESANPLTGNSYGATNGGPYGVTLGDWGGSLGYTCSNTNDSATQGYNGMIGAFLGLGIDEYGNFMNGSNINSSYSATYIGDNTSSGIANTGNANSNFQANRVGMRGPGATAWPYLNQNPTTAHYYPSSLSSSQRAYAVQQACETGYVWDYSAVTGSSGGSANQNGVGNYYGAVPVTSIKLSNYAVIPGAAKILSQPIANTGASYRGYANGATPASSYGVPITYNLSITTGGLLSLAYSYGGGNFQPIISGQCIGTVSSGVCNTTAMPTVVRFGFGGSTGGSKDIHEIMCFQAAPQNTSASSAGLNQKQVAKVQTGTQVYFAAYNANNWSGSLTSQYLATTTASNGTTSVIINPTVNWDASCVLTGIAANSTCATTGASGGASGTPAENPDTGRVMITYNDSGAVGVPFTWTTAGVSPLSNNEQSNLDDYDPSPASSSTWPMNSNMRLEYLRGVRTDEQNIAGQDPNFTETSSTNPASPALTGFRARTSVLGDIVDSSPTWVGPPNATFPNTWSDNYVGSSASLPENSGPNYASFVTANQSRLNVVYAGANDGFMHGFRTGFFDQNGTYDTSTAGQAANDGTEVIAYMPAYVLNDINTGSTFQTTGTGAGTSIQNGSLDYSNPLYAHRFNVDATPGTGDLFYNNSWHTWLVSGLGAGGNSIFALDITNPGIMANGSTAAVATDFVQTSSNPGAGAANLVIGEWSSYTTHTPNCTTTSGVTTCTNPSTGAGGSMVCVNVPTCYQSLGKTFGTPQIRRFHNGQWGAVFGNGLGSYNGDAGIFIMLVTSTTGTNLPTISFYYLSTGYGSASSLPNGIAYATPADLDNDHITDYVYAGDLMGNIWRFDLTSSNPANWGVTQSGGTPTPIYSVQTGTPAVNVAPITSKLIVASIASSPLPRIMIEFGTGQQTPFTNTSAATFMTSQQYLVGVWDWNMSTWNSKSSYQYDSLSGTSAPSGSGVPAGVHGFGSLQVQTVAQFDATGAASSASTSTTAAAVYRTVSNSCIGWVDNNTGCASSSGQYGWYLALSTGYSNKNDPNYLTSTSSYNGAQQIDEQVIFNPALLDGAFIVNTTIPSTSNLATCASSLAGGWTMAINPATGGSFTNSFFEQNHQFVNIDNEVVSGMALSGTGTASVVTSGGNNYLVTQTIPGTGTVQQINPPGGSEGNRLTWIEKR